MVKIGRIRSRSRGTTAQLAGASHTRAEADAHAALPYNDAHPAPEAPVDMGGQELQNLGAPLAPGSALRQAEGDALDQRIDDVIDDLAAEELARIADVDAEEAARIADVDAETTARTNADAALQAEIDAEEIARADADAALQAEIDAEEVARAAHAARTDNPHAVTKAQVGLTNAVVGTTSGRGVAGGAASVNTNASGEATIATGLSSVLYFDGTTEGPWWNYTVHWVSSSGGNATFRIVSESGSAAASSTIPLKWFAFGVA